MLKKGLTIYEPRGRAGEYAPLAVNLYRGCGHACGYCYAPNATYTDRLKFTSEPSPRPRIIEKLRRDSVIASETHEGQDKRVLLCFTCDPYQPINDIFGLTGQAIGILHDNGFNIAILTKGGKRAERDVDLLQLGDEFATTLTFLDEQKSLKWEPGAALPGERIEVLRKAHELGIRTWVSLEPVIEPDESLEIIRQTYKFVDLYKVGKLNYLPQAGQIDWPKFGKEAINLLRELGKDYYIKKDLRGYL